ncbi:MAG TPA: SpoIIE family protein phosphatase [Candidatus Baltobacteraceae bacterium]
MRHAALAVVLLVIFLGSTLWVRAAIARNAQTQQRLQNAQFERGRLLKLQLDEETGLRGYLATDLRVFLQPYDSARLTFPTMYARLDETVVSLQIDDEPVRREQRINALWLATVAKPLLRSPHAAQPKTQKLGKFLVDAFRENDNELTVVIQGRATAVTAATNGLISRVMFGSIALGVVIAFVVIGYGFAQSRLRRRLERSEVAYEKERRAVEVLQNAFLRPQLPSFPNVVLHGAYVPARDETRVGGDWYDAYAIDDRQLLFSIGDVSGHGLEAAVAMSRVRQSITTAAMTGADPAEVLQIANDVLLLQEGRMVTVACGLVDLGKGRVTFATAGHPPIIFVRPGAPLELLATGGPPLGAIMEPPYRFASVPIEAGAALVLYTDGLTEHTRDTVEGERMLIETVGAIDFLSCDDPAAALLARILSGLPPADDVAILTLTFSRAPARSLRLMCA